MDYIDYNVSQIAREFGLSGTNLGRQLRTHYPEVLEFRERARQRLGLDDGLPAARACGAGTVCRSGGDVASRPLHHCTRCSREVQCLLFRIGTAPDILSQGISGNRIKIRKQALKQQCKGKITGRGTLHAPTPEIVGKYAEALHLYRTTPMSARKTAKQTGVSIKGFTNTCKPGTRIWFAGGKASLTRKASRWTGHPCEDTTLPPPPNTLKPSPG